MELSIVLPAYNEAKRIGLTLQSVCSWLAANGRGDAEVVVVDNRSTDGTADVVRGYEHQWRNIRLIHEKRGGKGYAVQAGMRFATGRIRLMMDADNSTTIDHLAKMEPFLSQGYDVVIGSLAVPGARILKGGEEPLWRVALGKLGNLWIQLWAVPGVHDTQRGFKLFTAQAANAIFPKLTVFGWGFDVEVLAAARAQGFRIREVPVIWSNPPGSKVNVWAYPKVLMDTVKVGINRMRGKYRLTDR